MAQFLQTVGIDARIQVELNCIAGFAACMKSLPQFGAKQPRLH